MHGEPPQWQVEDSFDGYERIFFFFSLMRSRRVNCTGWYHFNHCRAWNRNWSVEAVFINHREIWIGAFDLNYKWILCQGVRPCLICLALARFWLVIWGDFVNLIHLRPAKMIPVWNWACGALRAHWWHMLCQLCMCMSVLSPFAWFFIFNVIWLAVFLQWYENSQLCNNTCQKVRVYMCGEGAE